MEFYDEKTFGKMKGVFFNAMKEENIKCLEPNEQCHEELIRSHSIQDSRILEDLAEDYHVYTIQIDKRALGRSKTNEMTFPKMIFERVSMHEATTFKGLCNKHDTEIFEPIDKDDLDMENSQHVFLLTYRAVLRETATLVGAARMAQNGYLKKADIGVISRDQPSIEGYYAVEQAMKAMDFYTYKKAFDFIYLEKQYDEMYWIYYIYDENANFAVSSIFNVDSSMNMEDVPKNIGINVFPNNNKTYVVFSCLKVHKDAMNIMLNDIIIATGYYQKYLISKLVLRKCENIVLAPAALNSWAESKKETILKFFSDTIYNSDLDYDNEELYLF